VRTCLCAPHLLRLTPKLFARKGGNAHFLNGSENIIEPRHAGRRCGVRPCEEDDSGEEYGDVELSTYETPLARGSRGASSGRGASRASRPFLTGGGPQPTARRKPNSNNLWCKLALATRCWLLGPPWRNRSKRSREHEQCKCAPGTSLRRCGIGDGKFPWHCCRTNGGRFELAALAKSSIRSF